MRSAPASVDYQVSLDRLCARLTIAAHAPNASAIMKQAFDRGLSLEPHVSQRDRPASNVIFEQAAAHDVALEPEVARFPDRSGPVVALAIGAAKGDIDSRSETHRAEAFQFLGKAGIEQRHHMLSAEQQGVDMIALRDRLVEHRPIFDMVALENSDAVEVVSEHCRAHESR